MDFLQRYKKWFILALVVLSFVMMAFTGRDGYSQGFARSAVGGVVFRGQALFSSIGNWFSDRWNFFTSMNELHHENQRLLLEIDRLNAELVQHRHSQAQNNDLALLVNLHLRYDSYAVLGADVVSHDPSNWLSTFTINRGTNDGVAVNMAVLAPMGFAGRISAVGSNYAVVTAVMEDGHAVSAQGERTGDTGIVRGDVNLASQGLLRMDFIDTSADLAVGDAVITNHVSSIFPPGILIGHIAEMGQDVGGMYAIVTPAVDFSRLPYVLVVTDIFD
ncbi:MAG: rod shape-determining protein MreC [Defluviitaleaceae bacterium]|nr:rod shape-determining protein MreC [Defluviitaleaceae bacterium]